ncbi:MAG TPA: SGNH/GDSL hydrolase family protein [Bryobacteraceae bacterium]|jgi:phospholipase/lecithinase/hemolysin|nr:SGNH/GDSL hydrolase family protein [Bryobacteraceae bacterium]
MSLKSAPSLLLVLAGSLFCSLQAAQFDAIYAFGDSLSDVGNAYIGSGGTIPGPPYFNGQFSNGNVWVQDLASGLGLAPLAPSLAGGNNYAVGSAETGTNVLFNDTSLLAHQIDLVNAQIPVFQTAHPVADPNALYTIWIGSNDLAAIPPTATAGQVQLDVGEIVGNIDSAVNALASSGAKNFLIVTVPDLGKTPEGLAAGAGVSAALSQLSASFDSTLVNGSGPLPSLAALAAGYSANISVLNTYSLLDSIAADPALYGFSNATDACLTNSVDFSGRTVCATPDQYLFWDESGHPTAAGQQLIADAALSLVTPEPASIFLTAGGLLGLIVLSRRRYSF